MRKLMLLCASLCAMSFVVAAPAHASNTRSWVSSSGSDSSACTQVAPCLTFAHAITQTSSGGEIDCMSGGDFGAVTITFSITIDCGEGLVGTATSGGTASIILNASSNAVVVLRNLDLNGFGVPGYGIDTFAFPSGTLIVQHCLIHGFGDDGIYFAPGSGRSTLQVSDTSIFNNEYGITLYPGSGVIISATFNRVEITTNSQTGLTMEGSGIIAGTLRQSLVANNGNGGIYALASAVYFTVEESSLINNLGNAGVATGSAGSNVEVGASTIGGNGTGVSSLGGGVIYTFGNNQMSANGSNGSFTPGGPGLQ